MKEYEKTIGVPRKTVVLSKYHKEWKECFDNEKEQILKECGSNVTAIEHVGSTSVPGLIAKPIIDIAAIYSDENDRTQIIEALTSLDYLHIEDNGIVDRLYFTKRIDGISYYHLHIYENGSKNYENQILFRDYLRRNPLVADEYSALKRSLLKKFKDDRPKYTEAKTEFILDVIATADKSDK